MVNARRLALTQSAERAQRGSMELAKPRFWGGQDVLYRGEEWRVASVTTARETEFRYVIVRPGASSLYASEQDLAEAPRMERAA